MTVYINRNGVWHPIKAMYRRTPNFQIWDFVDVVWVKAAGVWELVHQELSISFSDPTPSANGSGPSHTGNPGATNTPGTSVTGGSGSFTYFWSRQGSASVNGPLVCSNTAVASPSWSGSPNVLEDGKPQIEIWNLRVTDTVSGYVKNKTVDSVTRIWTDTT